MRIAGYNTHPAGDLLPLMGTAELAELAADIKAHGLLEAIVLHEGKVLDGRNRLLACERAGVQPRFITWDDANASPWDAVWSLNAQRRHLDAGQKAALRLKFLEASEEWRREREQRRVAADEARRQAAEARPRSLGGTFHAANQSGATLPLTGPAPTSVPRLPKAKEALAAAAGVSPRTAQDVLTVQKMAPGLFDAVANGEMPLKQAVAHVRQAAKRETAERIQAEPPPAPEGPYRVIVCDPPWKYDTDVERNPGLRGLVDYPDMTLDQLRALPVAQLAHEDCILWLWTTNAMMGQAHQLLDAWGFTPKTILTWDKERLGTGRWLRNVTEHCILAVRGNPKVLLTNQTTLIRESRREHSRKPEAFYRLVEELCPGSKLEMFARQTLPGWVAWGSEVGKFDAA